MRINRTLLGERQLVFDSTRACLGGELTELLRMTLNGSPSFPASRAKGSASGKRGVKLGDSWQLAGQSRFHRRRVEWRGLKEEQT
jgi:hypothetical protein